MNTVNMLLGLFGECTIDSGKAEENVRNIRLDWNIRPPGDYPWATIKKDFDNMCQRSTKAQKQRIATIIA